MKTSITVAEFKAWMEGFSESIDGNPTGKQWKKVKTMMARVSEEGHTIIYRDHNHWPWHYRQPVIYGQSAGTAIGALSSTTITARSSASSRTTDYLALVKDEGKQEALALTVT